MATETTLSSITTKPHAVSGKMRCKCGQKFGLAWNLIGHIAKENLKEES